jgi:hypothetical protein
VIAISGFEVDGFVPRGIEQGAALIRGMVAMNDEMFSASMLEDCCSQDVVMAELEPVLSI